MAARRDTEAAPADPSEFAMVGLRDAWADLLGEATAFAENLTDAAADDVDDDVEKIRTEAMALLRRALTRLENDGAAGTTKSAGWPRDMSAAVSRERAQKQAAAATAPMSWAHDMSLQVTRRKAAERASRGRGR